jgi:hypothetical protein
VVANQATAAGGATDGLTIGTPTTWLGSVANNLFANNFGGPARTDLQLLGADVVLRNNRLDTLTGHPAIETGTTDAPPQFMGLGDYRLQPTSPMRNGGHPNPAGGYPDRDLLGPSRPQSRIDIGAYEFAEPDLIFRNGFQVVTATD